jgi:hypothetical protein
MLLFVSWLSRQFASSHSSHSCMEKLQTLKYNDEITFIISAFTNETLFTLILVIEIYQFKVMLQKTELLELSSRANYTDRATTACR